MNEFINETPLSPDCDAATRNDAAFNRQFRHGFKSIDGVQMHFIIGGDGPETIVLLHGFPQSWYEWKALMPHLLHGHRVIAIDLPGLGDSTGPLPSYDKKTLATYVHRLLISLGATSGVNLVANDFESALAYALAANHREQIAGLLVMDFPVVGRSLTFEQIKPLSFHFSFFTEKPLAEQLVQGREGEFLSYFSSASRWMQHLFWRALKSIGESIPNQASGRPGWSGIAPGLPTSVTTRTTCNSRLPSRFAF